MTASPDFGWLIPTGNQRVPNDSTAYWLHLHNVLNTLEGRFHSAWMSDHLMDGQAQIPEALTVISYLAGLYPQLYWGSAVLSQGFRNPALLAKMGATLQNISGGRFMLGLGSGWKEDEHLAYGFDFPSATVRMGQMGEVIQICRKMWDPAKAKATFLGQHYQVHQAVCQPKPSPIIPIMIGGGGEKLTLPMVAKYADWWNLPGVTPDAYARKLDLLETLCAVEGRSIATIRKTWMGVVSIASTRAAAEQQLEAYSVWPGDTPLVGTPDEIRVQLGAFQDLGVDLFILAFADEPHLAGLNLFLDEVAGRR